MIWKQDPIYKVYELTKTGKVRLIKNKRVCKLRINSHGYIVYGSERRLHVRLLETFVCIRPKGMYACHKDDNKLNNKLDNLYWGTPTQNTADAIKNGKAKQLYLKGHTVTKEHKQKLRVLRLGEQKQICKYGHKLEGSNVKIITTTGNRYCVECSRKVAREYQRKRRMKK